MAKVDYTTFDEYLNHCDVVYHERLRQLRELVLTAVPEATERISWGLPTFYQDGSLLQIGACKNYIGFYPGVKAVNHFKKELMGYTTTKAAIHLPMNQALPEELLLRILFYNVEDNRKEAKLKKG